MSIVFPSPACLDRCDLVAIWPVKNFLVEKNLLTPPQKDAHGLAACYGNGFVKAL
ncbi:MAG: hypothetical protein RMK29_20130 [Myxococcales bacterium]|nr:hypothetical protein [Myxococcota bacterium]MDW8284019.1 hypothetical protein [Myxococcales bacterium]